MKLTITATEVLTEIGGVPARVWVGVTEAGTRCYVFVHRIAVHESEDASQFDRELAEQLPPGQFRPLGATLGATGQFPYGKLNPADEGELQFAVGSDRETETVVVDFGKPVAWVGMRPEDAEAVAQSLMSHAARARKGKS